MTSKMNQRCWRPKMHVILLLFIISTINILTEVFFMDLDILRKEDMLVEPK